MNGFVPKIKKFPAAGEIVPRRLPGVVRALVLDYFDRHPALSSPEYAEILDVPAETVRAILRRNGRLLATRKPK